MMNLGLRDEAYAVAHSTRRIGRLQECVEEEDDAEEDPMHLEKEGGSDGEDDDIDAMAKADAEEDYQFQDPVACLEVADGKVRFPLVRVPATVVPFNPAVLSGLAAVQDITAAQKRAISGHMCMPMPVHASPTIAFLAAKVEKGAQSIWKPRYIPFSMSVFHLREFMEAARKGLFSFHKSVTESAIQDAFAQYLSQMRRYERFQEDRVDSLFMLLRENPARTAECLLFFIQYLEEYSLYFIHSIERFLFRVFVEPHGGDITLEEMLTPNERPTLEMCENQLGVRQCLVDFFEIKVAAFLKHDAQVLEEGAQPPASREAINLQQLPFRIEVNPRTGQVKHHCPPHTVYRGYIDILTIYEYFLFQDTEGILGPDFAWDPNSWTVPFTN